MHCCVLQISGIQGTPLHPVSCRTPQFFAILALDVDRFDTYPAGAVVNFQSSGGSIVPAKILGPSEGGANYRTITYERSGSVVTHDCAPIGSEGASEGDNDGTGTSGSGSGSSSHASQDDTDSDVSSLTSVETGLPSSVVMKTVTLHQTLRLCGQRVHVVYGGWQIFLRTKNCTSCAMFLRQTACHRGWMPSPLPSLLPKLPNLVPNPQPRVQPNLLPRWQPSLQLESPFLWPLLSMCSSSESNTPARKSGTQSQFLNRAEHASQQAVPA